MKSRKLVLRFILEGKGEEDGQGGRAAERIAAVDSMIESWSECATPRACQRAFEIAGLCPIRAEVPLSSEFVHDAELGNYHPRLTNRLDNNSKILTEDSEFAEIRRYTAERDGIAEDLVEMEYPPPQLLLDRLTKKPIGEGRLLSALPPFIILGSLGQMAICFFK